jgi:hypothetical protein
VNLNEYKKLMESMSPVERAFYDLLYKIDLKLGKILAESTDYTSPGGE